VRRVSVLSSTQSSAGVLLHPRIMVAVSELLYRDGFHPYYGVPAVGIMPLIPGCIYNWRSLPLVVRIVYAMS